MTVNEAETTAQGIRDAHGPTAFVRVRESHITHPLPRLPSTFHNGFTTEAVKVDRMTEDKQRMTKVEDEHVADALTNMQPHCDELVSRLADAIRGLAVPRVEEAIISLFDVSHATISLLPYSHLQRSTPASISHFKCGNPTSRTHYHDCPAHSTTGKYDGPRLTDRSVTSRNVAQHIQSVTHHPVSARTIRRRLHQSGLSARRPLLRLPLTQNHRRLRRQWCDEGRMWTAEWNEIVFTDESRLMMLNRCVKHRHTGPAPGIMVWGGIAFKEGREEVADEPRSVRPTTARTDENVDRVLEVLRTNRRLSTQQIADTLHMSTFVVQLIVTEDLQMRKTNPGCLNTTQSRKGRAVQGTQNHPHAPKKARMSKSRIKTMIIVFFDIRGIVHCEFVPQGQTVNSAFYLEVLRRLKRRIARVRTDIKNTVKLHHDNATSHTAFIITNFLSRSNTPVIPLSHPLTVLT
ncbi:hypothetical protein LAZ67_13001035 [Cordylochernes scorpioides]|uniref:Transposase Tc1-like domain-containing protein n=1 Tax=Cordylochernes scorpioides TaxID=51811 RepID=A0ABY6L660_9ARAC|nr:hypothetical protein LAZ67_13001035 [Cordylochernes scorpioides]